MLLIYNAITLGDKFMQVKRDKHNAQYFDDSGKYNKI